MKINQNILDILGSCTMADNVLFLPSGQLDRKTYIDVNKCIENIGGKWNRKMKGHVFDHDPSEDLDALLLTGEMVDVKKVYQFFPTPEPIAEQMCDIAELDENSIVLEPECGRGDLADVIAKRGVACLCGVELNRDMAKYLKDKPYTVCIGVDFISEFAADANIRHNWTHIIMNPPFSKQQDIDHILAAYGILTAGGTLVSVISPSPFFRRNKKSEAFRVWLKDHEAQIIDVPQGAFKSSGTMIQTKIIKVKKQ